MENYPTELQEAIKIMYQMHANNEGMMMWKNYLLAKDILTLLDKTDNRSEHHTPYDKVFILNFIVDNISASDLPRFTIELLKRELQLMQEVTEQDLQEYDEPIAVEDIEEELELWLDYIDTEHFSNEEWCNKYDHHIKFDPIERTPLWEDIYYEVEKKVDAMLISEETPKDEGFDAAYWKAKNKVLTEMGIEWHNPQELNPEVKFD